MEKQTIGLVVPSEDPKKKKTEEKDVVDGKDASKKQDKDAKDGEELVRVLSSCRSAQELTVYSRRKINSSRMSLRCFRNG
jgi:hypothetical protein